MDLDEQPGVSAETENPFHHEPGKAGYEMMCQQNGFAFWWASELCVMLGYDEISKFTKAINKTMTVLQGLNIPIVDNVVQHRRVIDGKQILDYKLSRFACYLAAMNGDVSKPEVAKAQAYFVKYAELCRLAIEEAS